MEYKIYKIIYNNEVIYIGKTTAKLSVRKSKGYQFIDKDILKQSTIELIELTDKPSRERYWIEYYWNEGVKLVNRRNGDGMTKEEHLANTRDWYLDHKEEKKAYNKVYRKAYYEAYKK